MSPFQYLVTTFCLEQGTHPPRRNHPRKKSNLAHSPLVSSRPPKEIHHQPATNVRHLSRHYAATTHKRTFESVCSPSKPDDTFNPSIVYHLITPRLFQ
jgi:hypothetical protein